LWVQRTIVSIVGALGAKGTKNPCLPLSNGSLNFTQTQIRTLKLRLAGTLQIARCNAQLKGTLITTSAAYLQSPSLRHVLL